MPLDHFSHILGTAGCTMLSLTAVPVKYPIYEPGSDYSIENGDCAGSVICQAVTFHRPVVCKL